jgi:Tfp pilus assembly protein PilO
MAKNNYQEKLAASQDELKDKRAHKEELKSEISTLKADQMNLKNMHHRHHGSGSAARSDSLQAQY